MTSPATLEGYNIRGKGEGEGGGNVIRKYL